MCPECRADLAAKIDQARLTYEVQGRTFRTPAPAKPRKRKAPKRTLTDQQKEERRALDRARMRTFVRLSNIYRPMYELVLNEEKLKEGLHPDTIAQGPRVRAIAQTLLDDVADAEERAQRQNSAG